MANPFTALATKIGVEAVGDRDVAVTHLVGRGTVNEVYRVGSSSGQVIVRINGEPHRVDEFPKEREVMLLARGQGANTPDVLKIGRIGDVSYQVQSFVEGTHPAEADLRRWEELGEVMHRVHQAPAGLAAAREWERQVEYGLDQLGATDPLQELGLLDGHRSASLKDSWAPLPALAVGLCHGDVSMRNVIVDQNDRLVLLDWGCASFGVVPFADVAGIVGEFDPLGAPLTAFLTGYGTSWDELGDTMARTATLKAMDLCRWAIDRRPSELPRCLQQAHWAFDFYLDGAKWSPRPSGADPLRA